MSFPFTDSEPEPDPEAEPEAGYRNNNEILNCENCKGIIKTCRGCGQRIEILNFKVTNYGEGSIHRCERRRNY